MSDVLGYLKILMRIPHYQPTLPVQQVPLMFVEPFILSGYRPTNKSWSYYLLSFFQLHNESGNVWTHSLAFLLILLQVGRMSFSIDFNTHKDAPVVIGFAVASLLNVFLSSACHLLHTKSPKWHYVWFLIDYAGVTIGSFGTGLACFYVCSQKDVYAAVEPYFLPLNVLMSCLGFLCCGIAKLCLKDPHSMKRKLLMVGSLGTQATLLGMPVLARYIPCILDESCQLSSLMHLHLIFIGLVVSAITFSTRMPEQLKPGHFDLFGHGHQIFHVSVMVTILVELEGVRIDIVSGATAHTRPHAWSFFYATVALIAIELVTLLCMNGLIDKKVREVLSASKCE